MKPTIGITITRHVTETDFGDRVSWRSSITGVCYDDKPSVMRRTAEVLHALRAEGIGAKIRFAQTKTFFPESW